MAEYLDAISIGLANVLTFPNILIPVLGTLVAMVGAFFPGIGNSSLAALVLIATITWDPVPVLLMFGALTGSATFMGSITAILFNIPGNSSSAAVLLDGHPMARKGRARTAIACAATASATGSIFGVFVLLALLPMVQPFLLEFGPLERVLIGIWGLSTIIAIPNSSPSRALAVTLLGLLCAMIGSDPASGIQRWTFGKIQLFDGFEGVAVLLGFFTLSEIIGWRKNYQIASEEAGPNAGSTWEGIRAVFQHPWLTARSSILGTMIGIIPGVGGTVASFIAYGQAVQSSDQPESFGTGDIRGVIAPEAAVDSKDGGSLLPVLAFGLPGSEGGVILVTVLALHGLVPGTAMLTEDLPLSLTLIFALLLSNILTSIVGVTLAPTLSRLTRLRIDRIALPALIACFVTIVQLNGLLADLYVAVAFGLLGYFFKRMDWPKVPFVIAFILGSFIERNVALAEPLLRIGRVSFWDRPAAMIIAALIVVSMLWMLSGRKKAQLMAQPERGSEDTALAAVLFAASLLLALTAHVGNGSYSAYATAIAWATTATLGAILTGNLLRASAASERKIPASHVAPILLFAGTPFAVWLAGLPVAMAVVTGIWLATGREFGRLRPFWLMVWAAAVGIVVALISMQFISQRLAEPMLSAWARSVLGL